MCFLVSTFSLIVYIFCSVICCSLLLCIFFFVKPKAAYEMRISDWSSDVCSSDLSEAASLAGHLELGKLNVLYDDNSVTLAAGTDITFTEDRAARFAAYGWHVQTVDDGIDVAAIEGALQRARDETTRARKSGV